MIDGFILQQRTQVMQEWNINVHVLRKDIGQSMRISLQSSVIPFDDLSDLREFVNEQHDPAAGGRRHPPDHFREHREKFGSITTLVLTGLEKLARRRSQVIDFPSEPQFGQSRSEERSVGKEGRLR